MCLGALEEAEFYNITSLIKLIKDKISERDAKTTHVSKHTHIYTKRCKKSVEKGSKFHFLVQKKCRQEESGKCLLQ